MRSFPYILVATVLSLAACAPDTEDEVPDADSPAGEVSPPAAPAPTQPAMSADVTAEGGTQVAGKVEIIPTTDAANAFRVSVNLQNVPAGEHAWHIHQGACGAKDTPVVVPFTEDKDKPALASPLVAGADGAVAADVAVPSNLLTLDQLRSGDYSLHVHQKGGIDHGPTIACATL